MSELTRKITKVTAITALGLGGLGLAACGQASAEAISDLSTAERFDYDYGGGNAGTNISGENCLNNTAYDIFPDNGSPAALGRETDDTVTITPTSGNVLHLVYAGADRPLQPAGPADAAILSAYNCKIEY